MNSTVGHHMLWPKNPSAQFINSTAAAFYNDCFNDMHEMYECLCSVPEYHTMDYHFGKPDSFAFKRQFDDAKTGRKTAFGELFSQKLTVSDLEYYTMSVIADNAQDIVRWLIKDDEKSGKMRLTMPLDLNFGDEFIGSGFDYVDGDLARIYTNAMTVVIMKTDEKSDYDNPWGIGIITEYPCIESINELTEESGRPEISWTDDFGNKHITRVSIKGLPDDEYAAENDLPITPYKITGSLNAEDVYKGISESETFKKYEKRFKEAETDEEKDKIRSEYDAAVDRLKIKSASPDISGKHRKVPLKFENVYKQSLKPKEKQEITLYQ